MNQNTKLILYTSRILNIVDMRDEVGRGDLQGMIEAVVRDILEEKKANK